MKTKIVIVRYFDWVIIGALGMSLLFMVFKVFLGKDTAIQELETKIKQSDTIIKRQMKNDAPPETQSRNLTMELRTRLEHLPVISAIPRNPFFPLMDLEWPEEVNLVAGETQPVEIDPKQFRWVQIVERIPGQNDSIVDVQFPYDPELGATRIKFYGLRPGNTSVRLRDFRDTVYLFKVAVREKPEVPPPNGPLDVNMHARAPIEKGAIKSEAMVGIYFMDNNPSGVSPTVGKTIGALIFRKTAGRPDVEYIALVRDMLKPATKLERQAALKRFDPLKVETPPTGPVPTGGEGPVVPREEGTVVSEPTGPESSLTPPEGSYIFIDAINVEPGESYIYKIVTYSGAKEIPLPVPTKNPYVSPKPVFVPSLVEFAVHSASPYRPTFVVTRPDPDTGNICESRFVAAPGMQVGGSANIKVDSPPETRYKSVDFSTGCTLVAALGRSRKIEYRLRDTAGQRTYKVRFSSEGRVLYLTLGGSLRAKVKE